MRKPSQAIGLLLSGGLDSAILLAHLLDSGRAVQPFYVRCGLVWQESEQAAVRGLLRELASPRLSPLVVLDMPVADLYDEHWSVTGRQPPGRHTPDEAMYLPGRNPLLLIKAALWCRLRGIDQIALASLRTNPFGDATCAFFDQFQAALNQATGGDVRIVRPFEQLTKQQVLELGRGYPLAHTFSCVAPVDGLHCGGCNKCAERQNAFRSARLIDPTTYATAASGIAS
jgi:7-cyano-7-deazaguanine synthase